MTAGTVPGRSLWGGPGRLDATNRATASTRPAVGRNQVETTPADHLRPPAHSVFVQIGGLCQDGGGFEDSPVRVKGITGLQAGGKIRASTRSVRTT